eukprot:TRINITY_DN14071_c0_g1_i1.p1 TRINITY_DN14071_c0_g1~~TRINITY_DN14071_c0_g1_i1.p1  ORF type:complete len:282 (+),score=28.67 TRINITY_DN14071_c0_g1_i1:48-848(+)
MESQVKEHLLTVKSLNPYVPRPRLYAKLVEKTEIRQWSTSTHKSGKLFQATLEDETGQVRAVWFNDDADRDFSRLAVGESYEFCNFMVRLANRKFSTVDNDYEISVNASTTISEITDVPLREKFQALVISTDKSIGFSDILSGPTSDSVNVLGIVLKIGELVPVQTKTATINKRDIYLMDYTEKPLTVVLWGDKASNFFSEPRSVIAISSLRVSDLGSKRVLASTSRSQIDLQPDLSKTEQGQMLQAWFESQTEDSWQILTQNSSS